MTVQPLAVIFEDYSNNTSFEVGLNTKLKEIPERTLLSSRGLVTALLQLNYVTTNKDTHVLGSINKYFFCIQHDLLEDFTQSKALLISNHASRKLSDTQVVMNVVKNTSYEMCNTFNQIRSSSKIISWTVFRNDHGNWSFRAVLIFDI